MEVRLTQLDSKFKCLFTAFCNSHWEEWSKYKNNRKKNKTRERWRLISLSFTKTMWDLQVTGERDVLYTALMPQNEKIQRQYLRHASTTVRNWPHIHQVMMTEWRRTQKHCRQINWHITTREPVTILTAFGKHQEFQEQREQRLRLQTVAHSANFLQPVFHGVASKVWLFLKKNKNKRGRLGKTIKCVQLRVNLSLSKKLQRNQEKQKKDDQCTTRPRESAH